MYAAFALSLWAAHWHLCCQINPCTPGTHRADMLPIDGEEGEEVSQEGLTGVRAAYTQLWGVVRLPAVRSLAAILLLLRLGMLPAEAAAPLKLLERGVSKEALAGMVSPGLGHLGDSHMPWVGS